MPLDPPEISQGVELLPCLHTLHNGLYQLRVLLEDPLDLLPASLFP